MRAPERRTGDRRIPTEIDGMSRWLVVVLAEKLFVLVIEAQALDDLSEISRLAKIASK